jgi:hypothetical protein
VLSGYFLSMICGMVWCKIFDICSLSMICSVSKYCSQHIIGHYRHFTTQHIKHAKFLEPQKKSSVEFLGASPHNRFSLFEAGLWRNTSPKEIGLNARHEMTRCGGGDMARKMGRENSPTHCNQP